MLSFLMLFNLLLGCVPPPEQVPHRLPTLIVTTDLGQDPDDQQSLVRLLHYANEFDLRGIVLNADSNYDREPPVLKDSIAYALLDAYAEIETSLQKHDPRFPDAQYLRSLVKKGCFGNGERVPVDDYIGAGRDTEGSNWIFERVQESDELINISIWGGACDLAQALWRARSELQEEELSEFIAKIRVYMIGKQDSSNEWILDNFPDLWVILALDEENKWQSAYRGVFFGGDMSLTSKTWIRDNLHMISPLGAYYPDRAYTGNEDFGNPHGAMKEGDTPSWLYFLNNGLNATPEPSWGGWGGRFEEVEKRRYRDARDRVYDLSVGDTITHKRATVFRWRPDFQNDFAARVRWGASDFEEANHAPVVRVIGAENKMPLFLAVGTEGEQIIDASPSSDPDGDELTFEWMVYDELSNTTDFRLVDTGEGRAKVQTGHDFEGPVHVILRVQDGGAPVLSGYQRIIIKR